jgi:hypothetical protein
MKRSSRIVVCSDPVVSLRDLKDHIYDWINLYGEDAILTTDAGYNNVELILNNTLKALSEYKEEM